MERPALSRPRGLRDYDPDGDVDLAGFAGSLGAFAATVVAGTIALRLGPRQLPERFAMADVLLGGIATHKASRLLAKGAVTSPLRGWFTRFETATGASEHQESARDGHGVRHTLGELFTCPFCLAQWVGLAYVAGLVAAPRPTRALTAVFAVTAFSDGLQHAYERLRAS
jgi:hypothetical protein